jgi:hypothetical protein
MLLIHYIVGRQKKVVKDALSFDMEKLNYEDKDGILHPLPPEARDVMIYAVGADSEE